MQKASPEPGLLFSGKLILAPLTRGGNLPFRRLCRELGADLTVSEMALARRLAQRERSELRLLRRHPSETIFGVQLCGRDPATVSEAARVAEELGADFVDLNLGCPIDLFTRRGLGAALLNRPRRVAQIVAAMRRAVAVPVTVKLRTGWSNGKENFLEVARAAADHGAAAITLHARSRAQRYRHAADWDAIGRLAAALPIPVIGNGDLMLRAEILARWRASGCASVMVARGALIRPWVFREIQQGRDWQPTPEEHLGVVRRYCELALEHFGSDQLGRGRVRDFLFWHLEFFSRYRELDPQQLAEPDLARPLLQQRPVDSVAPRSALAALLRRQDAPARAFISEQLLAGAQGCDWAQVPAPPSAGAAPSWRDGEG